MSFTPPGGTAVVKDSCSDELNIKVGVRFLQVRINEGDDWVELSKEDARDLGSWLAQWARS